MHGTNSDVNLGFWFTYVTLVRWIGIGMIYKQNSRIVYNFYNKYCLITVLDWQVIKQTEQLFEVDTDI